MRVVCSYCGIELPPKEPLEHDTITHAMCPECLDHFGSRAEGWTLGELLDQFDVPVLAFDAVGRAITANRRTAEMMGIPRHDLIGLLCGELMECVNARLPGGCGGTIHCGACTVRRTIRHTIETGETELRVPVRVDRDAERIDMHISTNEIPPGIILIIEDVSVTGYDDGGRLSGSAPSR